MGIIKRMVGDRFLFVLLFTFLVTSTPSCGGGDGKNTSDFETEEFEVDFDKSEDTEELYSGPQKLDTKHPLD